jgi:hypothetical protein
MILKWFQSLQLLPVIIIIIIIIINVSEGSASRPGRFIPCKNCVTCWIGGWVGLSVGLDGFEEEYFKRSALWHPTELRNMLKQNCFTRLQFLPLLWKPNVHFHSQKISRLYLIMKLTRWRSGWGTALQTGRSRDRFPMVSLEFYINIILPAALWPRGRLSL